MHKHFEDSLRNPAAAPPVQDTFDPNTRKRSQEPIFCEIRVAHIAGRQDLVTINPETIYFRPSNCFVSPQSPLNWTFLVQQVNVIFSSGLGRSTYIHTYFSLVTPGWTRGRPKIPLLLISSRQVAVPSIPTNCIG
ncbi:uncharacterized protein LAJ45_02390 [Morchella importuna]|uniref:uncharacterized protein n=1 Tax=Morchella importuna TaxID=1174673 RepID=UPI001E8D2B05|nr:uncharacterized protein LAJ45_02390 [Morchella importuna]KAH8153577.1 hypothetical protein LAJ45_02390 [Morchella importuna]